MYLKFQINMGNKQYIHTASFEQNFFCKTSSEMQR